MYLCSFNLNLHFYCGVFKGIIIKFRTKYLNCLPPEIIRKLMISGEKKPINSLKPA